jgi:hypothetical protein
MHTSARGPVLGMGDSSACVRAEVPGAIRWVLFSVPTVPQSPLKSRSEPDCDRALERANGICGLLGDTVLTRIRR